MDNKEQPKEVVQIVQKPTISQDLWPRWVRWPRWRRQRRWRRPVVRQVITPIVNPLLGGCAGTRYGCCPDGVTSKNSNASNCGRRY